MELEWGGVFLVDPWKLSCLNWHSLRMTRFVGKGLGGTEPNHLRQCLPELLKDLGLVVQHSPHQSRELWGADGSRSGRGWEVVHLGSR